MRSCNASRASTPSCWNAPHAPDQVNGFLRNLVLYEPDVRLYLLDAQGAVLAASGDVSLPPGYRVPMAPVRQAAGAQPRHLRHGHRPG
jgi:hypothetical protein